MIHSAYFDLKSESPKVERFTLTAEASSIKLLGREKIILIQRMKVEKRLVYVLN